MTTVKSRPTRRAATVDATRAMDGLRRVVRALRSGNNQSERAIGVSSAQLFALRAIDAEPGTSLGDVAERTMTSQSSISEVVSRLVARGLVIRAPALEDRRRAELSVSAAGERLLEKAPATVQERLAIGFLSLPGDVRRLLADGFDDWMKASGLSTLPADMFFEDTK